jgi:glycosyltransferase involved in cell wall biosynthesis
MGVAIQPDNESMSGGYRLNGIPTESTTELPLVTVVTAVFNGQPHVAGCLESVIAQDYPNIEHIILDGGSRDGTVDVLRQYNDRITFWKSEPDKGVYDAWNKALDEARGAWICFLGIDDEFLPGAVSAYMALAARNPEAEYLCSMVKWVHPSGHERIVGEPWTWREFSRSMCTLHVGSMHKNSLFEKYGRFDLSYRISGDYEFLLRPRTELRSAFLPIVTVFMRAGGISDSVKALYEAKRAKLETGQLPKALVLFDLRLAVIKYRMRPLSRRILNTLQIVRLLLGRKQPL